MLDYIRRAKKSIITTIVIAFCVIMMAGFGVNFLNVSKQSDHDTAAKINDEKISFQAVEFRRAELEERLRRQFGANYAAIRPLLQLEQQAIDSIIDEQLLRNFIFKDLGLTVGLKQVEQETLKLPFFNKGFDPEMFRSYLQAVGMTEQGFTDQMRYEIALEQLSNFVADSQPFSRRELESLVREQETSYDFLTVEIDPKNYDAAVKVDPTELQKYFDSKAETYRLPRAVKFSYVSFPFSEFENQTEVPEDEIQALYQREQDNFRTPKEVQLQQIYLQFPQKSQVEALVSKDKDAIDPREEKLIQAQDITQSARSGADFTDLVKRFSEDQETKPIGGVLGWKKLAELSAPIGKAAAELSAGQISDPIQTDQGVYILKAQNVRESAVKPLAEVRDQLLAELRKQDAPLYSSQAAEDFLSKWSSADSAQPKTLSQFAEEQKRKATVFDQFAKAEDLGGALPTAIREKIMQYPVGAREIITTPEGSYVIEVWDVREAQVPTLEQVRAKVEADYKTEQAEKLAEAEGTQLLQQAKSLADLSAATGQKFKSQTFFKVKRASVPDGALQSPEVQEAAFQLREGHPLAAKPLWFKQKLYLVGLLARNYQAPADFDKLLEQRKTQEQQKLRERFSQNIVQYLRAKATIWVNPQAVAKNNHA